MQLPHTVVSNSKKLTHPTVQRTVYTIWPEVALIRRIRVCAHGRKKTQERSLTNKHSWAQRKLSPLNILSLINGLFLSLGFNRFNN